MSDVLTPDRDRKRPDSNAVFESGRRTGKIEMREEAAKLAQSRVERMGGVSDMARLLEGFAKQIRALTIETDNGI